MSTPNPISDRMRPPPDSRFATPELVFNLQQAAAELAAEPSVTTKSHRQKTLYRHGRVTIALFLFDAGASLPDHTASGAVTINVIEGHLRVKTPHVEHDLKSGRLLVLAPDVPHDVVAEERSTMLLQVHLDQPATAKE